MKKILFFTIAVMALLSVTSCKKSNGTSNSSGNGNDSATSIYSSTIAGNTSTSTFDFGPSGVVADAQ